MNYQILRSTPRTLVLKVYTSGDLQDLDADPTIVVTDGNGTAVTPGAVIKPGATTGTYHSVLPAQANLSVLTVTWTGVLGGQSTIFTQIYEVVGNVLFTEAEARAKAIVGQQQALADENKYPDSLIAEWRGTVGEMFETRLNRGVTRRYCRVKFNGGTGPLDLTYGYPVLANGNPLSRPGRMWDISRIISATIDGAAQTVGDLEIVRSKLHHTTGTWPVATPGNIIVEYEYGPDPVEAETHQRALDLLLANAAPSGFPSNATSINTEDGSFRITTFPASVEDFFKTHKARAGFGFA